MTQAAWIGLNVQERTLLLDALAVLRRSNLNEARDIDALTIKLVHSAPHPEITIGVHGGQVQWTLGNPYPIRVCDYDGTSDEDLPDIDERGQRCRMWWEPAMAPSLHLQARIGLHDLYLRVLPHKRKGSLEARGLK